MRRILCYILLLIFTAVLLYAGWNYFTIRGDYEEGRDSYAALEQYVSFTRTTAPPSRESSAFQEADEGAVDSSFVNPSNPPEFTTPIAVDFENLRKINPDIVGWIYIEGTNINYPIVQGVDNDYYLDRLFDGTYNASGSIFLDANCDPEFLDQNNVVYGHFMRDGSMFHDIRGYRDQAYFEAHPTAVLITEDRAYEIEIFSGYVSDTLGSGWDIQFFQEDYEEWLREITARSLFDSGIQPSSSDRILTLSTCSYEFTEARFVLHGRIMGN